MVSIGVTLALSWLLWLGVLPENTLLKGTAATPHVFKNHITHNLVMAFGAFIFAVQATRATTRRNRFLLNGLSALAAFNVLYMVEGRTGQLVLLGLIAYYCIWRLGRRGMIAAVALSVLAATSAYLMPTSSLHKRMARAIAEVQDWRPGALATTSMSHRLEFYRNTLPIVAEHPVLGVGTGGFVAAYARRVSGTESAPSRNPHNQYLLTTVQLGLPGLLLLFSIFWAWWRTAARLHNPEHAVIARALVITYLIAGVVSSVFMDHTEALLFVWASGILFAGQHHPESGSAPEIKYDGAEHDGDAGRRGPIV
jgi:O-antigen ligase